MTHDSIQFTQLDFECSLTCGYLSIFTSLLNELCHQLFDAVRFIANIEANGASLGIANDVVVREAFS